ncbi:hypothetical protein KSP39_PZI018472 [Platanthera zijinensis]|uniref:Uncharacterized protein n=1 Tax=Platanthera zijinensis TaxID=2320716 RepID=A0AAP0B3V1_9ASPA
MARRPHQPAKVAFLPPILEGTREKLFEVFRGQQFDVIHRRRNVNVLDEVLPCEGTSWRDYTILAELALICRFCTNYSSKIADACELLRELVPPAKEVVTSRQDSSNIPSEVEEISPLAGSEGQPHTSDKGLMQKKLSKGKEKAK